MLNKRGQVESIIFFFILMVGIFIASIIVLGVVNRVIDPFQVQLNATNVQASNAVGYVHDKFTSVWDMAIVLIFFVNVIILFVSSFLVDIHPAFLIIYIFAIIFLFAFGNMGLQVVDSIWLNFGRDTVEGLQTPMQQFILNNFQLIMLGVVILSGVLMYAKFKFFGSSGGNTGEY